MEPSEQPNSDGYESSMDSICFELQEFPEGFNDQDLEDRGSRHDFTELSEPSAVPLRDVLHHFEETTDAILDMAADMYEQRVQMSDLIRQALVTRPRTTRRRRPPEPEEDYLPFEEEEETITEKKMKMEKEAGDKIRRLEDEIRRVTNENVSIRAERDKLEMEKASIIANYRDTPEEEPKILWRKIRIIGDEIQRLTPGVASIKAERKRESLEVENASIQTQGGWLQAEIDLDTIPK